MNQTTKSIILTAFLLFSIIFLTTASNAAALASKLRGKILIQVEEKGEAWYVNPNNDKRYYLGRPADAFNIMRTLGVGISEENYAKFSTNGAQSLAGSIVLRVLAKGEAYYVHPDTFQLHYLGRPADAFALMRKFGLGISNANLAQIITPVPVELTSFTANVLNGQVQLDWETATELNNAGFSIQRSKDNNKFIDLAFVKGKGTTTTQSLYSYTDKSGLSGKYYYRLKQVDFNGSVTYSKSTEVDLGLPKDYALEQNYPNPFNPSTTIEFSLPAAEKVSLKIYNLLGQVVTTLVNGYREAGTYNVNWDASNLSTGIYIYRVEANSFSLTKKMTLLK